MNVGFTGTRKGMTAPQRASFRELLRFTQIDVFHDGLCKGSDAHAAAMISLRTKAKLVGHPCNLYQFHADQIVWDIHDEVRPTYPPLERNRHIVAESKLLIATPGQDQEAPRSGTWSTIRHARKQGKEVIIIYPSGAVERESNGCGK